MAQIVSMLGTNEELKKKVKRLYNKTDEEIAGDVKILREWLKKQPHLPQEMDDEELEKTLISNKCRVEKTKTKIDAYYTLRGIYPEYFQAANMNPKSECMVNSLRATYFFPLPKVLENGERLVFFKIRHPDVDLFNILHQFSMYFYGLELLNKYDYNVGIRGVADCEGVKLAHAAKLNPVVSVKAMHLWQKGLSLRFAGIHYINAPKYLDVMVNLFTSVAGEQKVKVHTTMDSLYKVIPKEHLPEEYGGKAGKREDLQAAWIKQVEANGDFMVHRASLISNEKLRVGPSQYNDLFGIDGTFKKLNLD